jgi:hypothetical protein
MLVTTSLEAGSPGTCSRVVHFPYKTWVFKKIGGKLNVFNQFNYVRNCKKSGGF